MKSHRNYSLIASIFIAMALIFAGQSLAGDIDAKLPDNDNTSSFQVKDSIDNVLMKVQSGGNVGIGTTSPNYKMTIGQGSSDNFNYVEINSATWGGVLFHGGGRGGNITYNHSDNYLQFGTSPGDGTGPWTRMRIDKDGNVGIGTISPGTKLEIFDSLPSLRLNGHSTSSPWQILVNSFGLTFYRETGGGHDLRIDNSGNVQIPNGNLGIGTTAPQESLHTTGKIRTDGITGIPGGLDVRVFGNTLYYQTSSSSYKKNIRDLEDEFHKILQANPKSFMDKKFGLNEIGYIAEELDQQGLNNLIIYEEEKPIAIKYDLVSLYILEVVKDQEEMIKMQQEELRTQSNYNKVLEERLAKIEARLNEIQ